MAGKINLGEMAAYSDTYDASLLMPIARSAARNKLQAENHLQGMLGQDIWQAYEVSWLNASGKPKVARAVFRFDCHSPAIIESKSFKYYLNSYNQTRVASESALLQQLERDLASACGAPVRVALSKVGAASELGVLDGFCVDELDSENFRYTPDKGLLNLNAARVVDHCLYSHLLKSNCPVTGQPDWATLWLKYSGQQINAESFLQYVISFRQHQDFHENCVEKVYCDVMDVCQPQKLSVYACYTRRGGLDINPFRSNHVADPPTGFRVNRQ